MCSEFCFYLKLPRPIIINLGHRISSEMADFNANLKQRVFKSITFRFPSSRRDNGLDTITEVPENAESCIGKDVRQRPLPQLPGEKHALSSQPWYKPIDRRKGESLVVNGVDGCFLVRPSSKGQECFTLTLFYHGRPYNIPIRLREDGFYSLGTPKQSEKCFGSIQEMVQNYFKEELILFSNGVEAGRTKLTIYPG